STIPPQKNGPRLTPAGPGRAALRTPRRAAAKSPGATRRSARRECGTGRRRRIHSSYLDVHVDTSLAQPLNVGSKIPRHMSEVGTAFAQDTNSQSVMWIVGFRLERERIARAETQRLIVGRFRPEP